MDFFDSKIHSLHKGLKHVLLGVVLKKIYFLGLSAKPIVQKSEHFNLQFIVKTPLLYRNNTTAQKNKFAGDPTRYSVRYWKIFQRQLLSVHTLK